MSVKLDTIIGLLTEVNKVEKKISEKEEEISAMSRNIIGYSNFQMEEALNGRNDLEEKRYSLNENLSAKVVGYLRSGGSAQDLQSIVNQSSLS